VGDKFEATKRVFTSRISKEKGQTIIYKTLHRKLRIEQHESKTKLVVN